ncbi:MAG: hypothetical protein Q8M37_08015 [Nevskia sp.]|nr:hypothetical protein [Nevskia sp.]
MRYLQPALYAEGKDDYAFLSPLLLRLCEDLCARHSQEPVECGPVLGLDHPACTNDAPRAERIIAAAREAAPAWNVLFIHTDGGNDPDRQREQRVAPALSLLESTFGSGNRGVAVVPICETEAWLIHDGDTLRTLLGTTLTDIELDLPPNTGAVERVADPKRVYQAAFAAGQASPRRRRRDASSLLEALGEQLPLERLRGLSAFKALEAETMDALRELRIV